MPSTETILLRIVLAIIAGGIIGGEREYRSKSAGFRTIILISIGSCLFTLFSAFISPSTPDRIASNIVTGIGFLGAGVIFRGDNRVNGLTTAATIWAAAAIGMGIGAGYYLYSFIACLSALLVLVLFMKLENIIDKLSQTRNYKIVCEYNDEKLKYYEERFVHHHLKFKRNTQKRKDDELTGIWIVQGAERNHDLFIRETMNDNTVKEFEF
ncbi:MAG: MgtC/SapB family protein [Bacteroidetes bacterium]|nr:MgtC/SapB family protein [Bacteroidota bacterium]MBS1608754.1 MgtC/SapB family protein [Bacteroidota bacterium]